MTYTYYNKLVNYFFDKGLITKSFAENLLSWKNPGFSIENSFRIYGSHDRTRESIGQYLARAPISLQKIEYIKEKGKVILHTKYNDYFKENLKLIQAEEFIALLTKHIPPARLHYIRYYGLYSSRTRGRWKDIPHIVNLAPEGWKLNHKLKDDDYSPPDSEYYDNSVSAKAKRSAWARLIQKVYEVDPLICPKCQSEMRVLAVITDKTEVRKILRHLCKIGRAPPNMDVQVQAEPGMA